MARTFTGDPQRRPTVLRRPINRSAFVQQQPRRVDVAVVTGHVQWSHAALLCVYLCTAVQQLRHRLDVAGPCRSAKWEFRIQVLLEQLDDGRVAVDFGGGQRRCTVLIRPIELRAFV